MKLSSDLFKVIDELKAGFSKEDWYVNVMIEEGNNKEPIIVIVSKTDVSQLFPAPQLKGYNFRLDIKKD